MLRGQRIQLSVPNKARGTQIYITRLLLHHKAVATKVKNNLQVNMSRKQILTQFHVKLKPSPPPRLPVSTWNPSNTTFHMWLDTSLKTKVTKHAFYHLQTWIHLVKRPTTTHTHTLKSEAQGSCVWGPQVRLKGRLERRLSGKLLLNELICHRYAKSC